MIGSANIILWAATGAFAAICLVILVLLAGVVGRQIARSDSAPGMARRTNWDGLVWTVLPVAIFAVIAVPLLRLAYLGNTPPVADMTVEVTGNMWFWTYGYSDLGGFAFEAPMLSDVVTGEPRLAGLRNPGAPLDNRIVVPVGKTVRLVTTGDSVIYSWAIPAIGAKVNALPGRPGDTWFRATREGRYTSEYVALCSASHVFIPIEVDVVSPEHFEQWLARSREKLSSTVPRVGVEAL